MHMIMFVLNNPDRLDDVLDAWYDIGIRGATVVDSTGIYRRRPHLVSARFAYGLSHFADSLEEGHCTLFAVVADAGLIERCIQAAEQIVGDLSQPNTGVIAVWSLSHARGARKQFVVQEEDGE